MAHIRNHIPRCGECDQTDQQKVAIETRKVISREILEQCIPNNLFLSGDQCQNVEHWLLDPGKDYGHWIVGGEVIKSLMMEISRPPPAISVQEDEVEGEKRKREAMEMLLLMANHQQMVTFGLRDMCHGHHFVLVVLLKRLWRRMFIGMCSLR
jgi:hypothetical protein